MFLTNATWKTIRGTLRVGCTYLYRHYICKEIQRCLQPRYLLRALSTGSVIGVNVGLRALPVKSVDKPETKLPEVNPSTLTSSTLIKNAAVLTVDSSSTLLTQTFIAVMEEYRLLAQDIERLMDLLQQHRQAEKMGFMTDDVWQQVIEARVNIDDRRQVMQKLEAIFDAAVLTLETAAEAAFQSGSEEAAMMGRDRCQYANTQVAMARSVTKQAEEALVKLQADCIRETPTDSEESDEET